MDVPQKGLNLTPVEKQKLRNCLLNFAYNSTSTQLQLYQRGQRRNATVYIAKRKPRKNSVRKLSLAKKTLMDDDEDAANMPSEKVLQEIKLDKELDTLQSIYTVAREELADPTGAKVEHAKLIAAIEALTFDNSEMARVQQELQQNQEKMRLLKAQLASDKHAAEQRMKEQAEKIESLRHNRSNVRLLNELELRLVQKWEENRFTQAEIVGQNEERALEQQIDEYRRRTANEERIICEVQSYSEKQFEELRAQTDQWRHKYTAEMQRMNEQTAAKEKRIASVCKSHERHRETYEQRKQFVSEYLALKAEEQRLYQQQIYRVECGVRIQAWWRGTMVRRGFGPFKKKSKKGRKGKPKGK